MRHRSTPSFPRHCASCVVPRRWDSLSSSCFSLHHLTFLLLPLLWRSSPPGCQQFPSGHKIRLLHFYQHLLVRLLIGIREACPLANERLERPKAARHILKEALPRLVSQCDTPGWKRVFWHVLQSISAQDLRQFPDDAILAGRKQVSSLMERLHEHVAEAD